MDHEVYVYLGENVAQYRMMEKGDEPEREMRDDPNEQSTVCLFICYI